MGEDPVMSRATAERLLGFAALGLKARFGDDAPESYEDVLAAIAELADGAGSADRDPGGQ